MKPRRLTAKEIDLATLELAERCKDVVYATAEARMRELLKDLVLDWEDTSTPLEVTYHINMVTGDIIQVLARYKR